jgi:four helix bundle protein
MKTKSVSELDFFNKSHRFVLDIYRITQKFPKSEIFGLTSQMRRSAVSIPANLAEGYARKGKKDKIRFYNIAEGSINECRYYILLSKDLSYSIDNNLIDKLNEISKMLKQYIRSIEKSDDN